MKLKKFNMILVASILAVTSLVGCSNTNQTNAQGTTNDVKKEETVSEDGRPMRGNLYTDGKLPLVKEKETIRVAIISDTDPNETVMAKELEEKTNVRVEWDYYPSVSWQEKKNLLFAAGDLPDAIMGRWCLSDTEVNNYSS